MAPSQDSNSELSESDLNKYSPSAYATKQNPERKILWDYAIALTLQHIAAVYSLYLYLTQTMWATRLYSILLISVSAFGVTAGAHRLWTHKSYKAKLPLRILLMIMQTLAMQLSLDKFLSLFISFNASLLQGLLPNPMAVWVHDHRMHHKYSETDADPHNAKRGFFYSHIGWLLVSKHPEFTTKCHTVDMSDVWADPLVRFQYKYFYFLVPVIGFAIPCSIPTLWGENFLIALMTSGNLRYIVTLNGTFLVNSAAHMWGFRPYDKNINPAENLAVNILAHGEGFHNYHHVFPWDYKAAELGNYSVNLTTFFIDLMAKIGWAYDRKTVTPEMIKKTVERKGDGSHIVWGHES